MLSDREGPLKGEPVASGDAALSPPPSAWAPAKAAKALTLPCGWRWWVGELRWLDEGRCTGEALPRECRRSREKLAASQSNMALQSGDIDRCVTGCRRAEARLHAF